MVSDVERLVLFALVGLTAGSSFAAFGAPAGIIITALVSALGMVLTRSTD